MSSMGLKMHSGHEESKVDQNRDSTSASASFSRRRGEGKDDATSSAISSRRLNSQDGNSKPGDDISSKRSSSDSSTSSLREDWGAGGPPSPRAAAAPSPSRPLRSLRRPVAPQQPACKPSPAAGCRSSCRPGAGAEAPVESPRKGGRDTREPRREDARKRRTHGPHCRRWPPRDRGTARMARSRARPLGPGLSSPPTPQRYCPSPASPAAPKRGAAALHSLPARCGRNSERRSLPCSRLRHDLREAASRAAAASSGRRRHVFLPYTWPCHRSQWLRSAPLLQTSQAEGRLLFLQLLPLRRRLREPPGARALLPPGSPFPLAAAAASSVFLTQPKPPPSWFAPQ
ncbi:translation initiation factor IF-2-like [Zalophus californianus]|uniref:Translation initiation factor IF-2-like n=1 Tax=Zalophus californianus TaxID=9704 RepID=A0A6J2B4Z8_ZALCA|nr:translation initiation factor IF-2-like [Zalophus californianus]